VLGQTWWQAVLSIRVLCPVVSSTARWSQWRFYRFRQKGEPQVQKCLYTTTLMMTTQYRLQIDRITLASTSPKPKWFETPVQPLSWPIDKHSFMVCTEHAIS
jgi:hypothetical protein